jgi:uncharacterized protein
MLYGLRREAMLIEFRVANHRSLRDEQVLTMEAGRVGDDTDQRPRRIQGYPEELLTVAGLYGANASGKSNVLTALSFMRDAVVSSHRFWSPVEGESAEASVPRDSFAWGTKKTEPSLFEVTFLIDQVRYQYGFQVSDDRFLEEWLYAWPSGKKQVWFERDNQKFKFGEHLKGENKIIAEVTRPNALFLSAAAQHKHTQLAAIFTWFLSFETLNMREGRYNEPYFSFPWADERSIALLLEAYTINQAVVFPNEKADSSLFVHFRDFLKQGDTGIMDLRIERNKAGDKRSSSLPHFLLKHQSDTGDAWLPLREESNGTQTLFRMALPILNVLKRGGLLIVDEIERSLHPCLARKIVDQFNDPSANPRNAQIIFTTHDTNLLGTTLGEPALRRDQVWLTEKDAAGATVLYPLTDYKPRKAENLERGYLQGRYGAIPFLNDFLVGGR